MKTFIKSMLSSKDDVSSKRVMGITCILIYFCIFVSAYFIELSISQVGMANMILGTGTVLLGATAFQNKKNG